KPHILAAAVYDKDGRIFADYVAPDHTPAALPVRAPAPGHRFLGDRVVVSHQIFKDQALVGTIYLDFDLIEVWLRVAKNCGLVALMIVVAGVIAFFVTSRLQRAILRPILDL